MSVGRILIAVALTLFSSVSAAAFVPSCGDSVTQNSDGSLSCASGWVLVDYSPLLPPITWDQASVLVSSVLALWAMSAVMAAIVRTARSKA